MSLYVVETDAPCTRCNDPDGHGYVTTQCTLAVFVDYGSARWVSRAIEGSAVREIREVPEGINYTLYLHENGRASAKHPRTVGTLSGG